MIHVTQGHESGIGLEVFLKSLIYLSQSEADQITLHANKDTLIKNSSLLPYPIKLSGKFLSISNVFIQVIFIQEEEFQSTYALESALKIINKEDVLFTLPTSKDQLILNNENTLGYTEYLRKKYNNNHLVMSFLSNDEHVCLLTDHIPLSDVSKTLTEKYIVSKIENIFQSLGDQKTYVICGINPHSGEDGLLGNEEERLKKATQTIKKRYPKIRINDSIIPADTHHFHKDKNTVFIFTAHDQALTSFKNNNGILAANITLGLPFKRLSVDHGVAFSLFGKNMADSTGCYYCLKKSLQWQTNG